MELLRMSLSSSCHLLFLWLEILRGRWSMMLAHELNEQLRAFIARRPEMGGGVLYYYLKSVGYCRSVRVNQGTIFDGEEEE